MVSCKKRSFLGWSRDVEEQRRNEGPKLFLWLAVIHSVDPLSCCILWLPLCLSPLPCACIGVFDSLAEGFFGLFVILVGITSAFDGFFDNPTHRYGYVARRLADLVIDNMDEFVVPLFFTWGYRWRPSYRTMTTEEIGDFLHQAKKNAADSNITSLRCAEENLPCCPQWNGIIVDVETYMGAFSTQGTINSVGAFRTGEAFLSQLRQ